MSTRIHLTIMQPPGYIHSQGFLDQARYTRHQFRQLDAEVTLGKNRLREDSVNIIFGAHLGFPAELRQRYTCVFFNLEQLGDGGARVSQDYLNLLGTSAVIDYDERNLAAYGCKSGDVPVVSFEYAPYLAKTEALALPDRPIDLLFFGSINERRKSIFDRIEACGWRISYFDHPLYGDERDQFIRQAKAVFNCHFYESSRFEQARAFHTLSLGTPVISERTARTTPPAAFEDAVTWVSDENLDAFFRTEFMTSAWIARAQQQLQAFEQSDPSTRWQIAYGYCQALWKMGGEDKATQIWRPTTINLGAGEDYRLGWLNVATLEKEQPDLVLDLGREKTFPIKARTQGGGNLLLEKSSLDRIYAKDILEYNPRVNWFMRNILALLKENGEAIIIYKYLNPVDLERVKAILEDSGIHWETDYLNYRIKLTEIYYLDTSLRECKENAASFIYIKMIKSARTLSEKTKIRSFITDFGDMDQEVKWKQSRSNIKEEAGTHHDRATS